MTTSSASLQFQDIADAQQLIAQLEPQGLLHLQLGGSSLALPQPVTQLLREILLQTAHGQGVVVLPLNSELSSQEAAQHLHVSRQWLINEAEVGRVAYRKIGSHRRFQLQDILEFASTLERESLEARQILADESQRLGLDH
jgi:hypothetical protein